jgi:hypothetical protein
MVNFAETMRVGMRKVVEQIPRLREEARLRYLADSTAYRREKYSCVCYVDTRVGVFLDSPLCYVHHPERVDLDPQYRDVDPPASWINEHFSPNTMTDCFKENQ